MPQRLCCAVCYCVRQARELEVQMYGNPFRTVVTNESHVADKLWDLYKLHHDSKCVNAFRVAWWRYSGP